MAIRNLSLCAALLLVLVFSGAARAGVVINIQNVQVAVGGSVFFDVTATADPGVNLDNFGLTLEIVPTVGHGRVLKFVNPQVNPHLTDPNYVFFGNSKDYSALLTEDDTVYKGSDLRSDDSVDMPLDAVTRLLARIEVTTLTSDAPLAGDQFWIQIDRDGTSFFDNDQQAISFGGNAGLITVTGVPEPGGAAALGVAALGAWLAKRYRRKAKKPTEPAAA